MAAYSYLALDAGGRQHRGVLESDSARMARQTLRDKGLTPLEIHPAVQRESSGGLQLRLGPRMNGAELAAVTRQMATLIGAGLPLADALQAVAQQLEKATTRGLLMSVRAKVLEGHSLANALRDYPGAFPDLYCATIAAGEHSGHLDLVMERLADYVEASQASRQKIMLAMLYPVILLVVAILIVTGLMAFVVPDVVEVFVGQGKPLPGLTEGLLTLSHFVTNWGWLVVIAIVAALFMLRTALKGDDFRLRFDRRVLHTPLVGRISRGMNTARFASTLSILTGSGVPLVDAMQIAGEVLGNAWLRRKVQEATQEVREGTSLRHALERSGYFPPIMVHMIASGEASGTLDDMLGRVATSQQRSLDALVATVLGLVEPLMLLFMGACVLLIVVAILLPIFNLNTLL